MNFVRSALLLQYSLVKSLRNPEIATETRSPTSHRAQLSFDLHEAMHNNFLEFLGEFIGKAAAAR